MSSTHYLHSKLTSEIISCAYEVYNILGYGFSENVYEKALCLELQNAGVNVETQRPVKVHYRGEQIAAYRLDIFVEEKVIVEIKAIEQLHPRHEVQLVNYLKATQIEVGLLINFGPKIKVKRRIFSNTPLPTTR